jgi:hypothetical protein
MSDKLQVVVLSADVDKLKFVGHSMAEVTWREL